MKLSCDIIIVGGGAAGLFAAISAKKYNRNCNITIIERNDRVAKKLITTGNGRCNLSNTDLNTAHFHSSDSAFLQTALSDISAYEIAEFFRPLGVEVVSEDDGRIFPASKQASSVVDALRFSISELGINLITDTKVTSIKKVNRKFIINSEYEAKAVILATGGLAGGERLGCDESGYNLAKSLGHTTIKTLPAITQIKTDTSIIKRFKGIKVDALVTAMCGGTKLRSEYGELLFCDYGISGPPVFQISGSVSGKDNCSVVIDFLPSVPYDELVQMLIMRRKALSSREAQEFLTGFMNKRIGQYFVKAYCDNAKLCRDISDIAIKKMANEIKNFALKISGVSDFKNAQVTKGGIDCRFVNPETLESNIVKGLFFAGENLDVDGDCGGYNLHWALVSAKKAAKALVEFIK